MFEHLDDTEGTPFELARPAEARRRAARMQARRRSRTGAGLVAVMLIAVLGLARALPDRPTDAEVTSHASQPEAQDEATDPTSPDGPDGEPRNGGIPRALRNTLTPASGSTAEGHVTADAVDDTSWEISITVVGAAPSVAHRVMVQHRLAGGRLSDIQSVCEGQSDADGSFACSAVVTFDELVPPASVTVGALDPSSRGYRPIGNASLEEA